MADEKNFNKNKFLFKYREFIDSSYVKQDLEGYRAKIKYVDKITEKVDFSKNVLVICQKDISKELFLAGFSRQEEYKSYKYCNVGDLMDAFFGNKSYKSGIEEGDVLNSQLDINQDVLCLAVNYYETTGKTEWRDEVVINTVMNRGSGKFKDREKLCWIYSKGTREDLAARYPNLLNLFLEGRFDYILYDLNQGKNPVTQKEKWDGKSVSKPTGDLDFD